MNPAFFWEHYSLAVRDSFANYANDMLIYGEAFVRLP